MRYIQFYRSNHLEYCSGISDVIEYQNGRNASRLNGCILHCTSNKYLFGKDLFANCSTYFSDLTQENERTKHSVGPFGPAVLWNQCQSKQMTFLGFLVTFYQIAITTKRRWLISKDPIIWQTSGRELYQLRQRGKKSPIIIITISTINVKNWKLNAKKENYIYMLQGGSIPGCEGGDISNQPTFVFINIKYAPSYNFIIKDNGHN